MTRTRKYYTKGNTIYSGPKRKIKKLVKYGNFALQDQTQDEDVFYTNEGEDETLVRIVGSVAIRKLSGTTAGK